MLYTLAHQMVCIKRYRGQISGRLSMLIFKVKCTFKQRSEPESM